MRVMAAAVMAAALAAATMPAATAARADDTEIERLVRQHVQPMLIAAGGMAVAVHIDGRTLFFNYGLADMARKEPITSDSLFNLASIGKVFLATLLAQAVERGEVARNTLPMEARLNSESDVIGSLRAMSARP